MASPLSRSGYSPNLDNPQGAAAGMGWPSPLPVAIPLELERIRVGELAPLDPRLGQDRPVDLHGHEPFAGERQHGRDAVVGLAAAPATSTSGRRAGLVEMVENPDPVAGADRDAPARSGIRRTVEKRGSAREGPRGLDHEEAAVARLDGAGDEGACGGITGVRSASVATSTRHAARRRGSTSKSAHVRRSSRRPHDERSPAAAGARSASTSGSSSHDGAGSRPRARCGVDEPPSRPRPWGDARPRSRAGRRACMSRSAGADMADSPAERTAGALAPVAVRGTMDSNAAGGEQIMNVAPRVNGRDYFAEA